MAETGRIAFVGIGNMGWPMAARLVGGKHDVAVCDIKPGLATEFARAVGGTAANDAARAAKKADIIITMLPNSSIVESAITAMRSALAPGSLLIEMSSGVPGTTRRLAEELEERGVTVIDAPVSGGVARAKTGELSIMVGGTEDAVARAKPTLQLMGSSITRVGAIGAGQAMKALNNLVSAGGFLIGIEALLIGKQFGLDPAQMVDVLNTSSGMNNSTQKKFRQFVLTRRFDSGFGLDLMVKDLSIALEVGRSAGIATPLAALCREMWASAHAALGSGLDHTAMARFSELLAGNSLVSDRFDACDAERPHFDA